MIAAILTRAVQQRRQHKIARELHHYRQLVAACLSAIHAMPFSEDDQKVRHAAGVLAKAVHQYGERGTVFDKDRA